MNNFGNLADQISSVKFSFLGAVTDFLSEASVQFRDAADARRPFMVLLLMQPRDVNASKRTE